MRVEPLEQAVRVVAVALLGRDPPGRGVRMRQQAACLELGQLGADRGRRDVEARPVHERPRPDRLAGRDERLDDAAQDLALTVRELGLCCLVHHLCRDFRRAAPP